MTSLPSIIGKLVSLGERQLQAEKAAKDILCQELSDRGMPYDLQTFPIIVPVCRSAVLTVDNKELPGAGTSFSSGRISGKDNLLSSALPMAESPNLPNINVNPSCPIISRGNVYRKPAIAVSHDVLKKILDARDVEATVETDLILYEAHNIVCGNRATPRTIIFTHYDSIGPGANDNASGVAATLEAITRDPTILERALIVLSGAEELSTDMPYYWGAGYRTFIEAKQEMMNLASTILVIDSVGNGPIEKIRDSGIIRRAFPIGDRTDLVAKTTLITGDINQLMRVYHSEADTEEKLSEESIEDATAILMAMCL